MGELLWLVLTSLLEVVGAIAFFMIVLPLVPTAVERLSNKPNRYRGESVVADYDVSDFGFFTSVSPRQAKIIEAGDNFVRCLMHNSGRTYRGLVDSSVPRNSKEFWDEVSTTDKDGVDKDYYQKGDAHPVTKEATGIPFVDEILYMWSMYVYTLTGYVFIGIYPFRRVRTYKLNRYKKDQHTGEITKVEDYSDHYRVGDFGFPVVVPEADTQDMVPVSISIDIILRVYNPFMVAYGTDDWAQRVVSAVQDKVTGYTRPKPLEDVLSARSDSEENELANAIMSIGTSDANKLDTIITFGVRMVQVLVTDISAVQPKGELQQKLAGAALARVEREALVIRATGERDAMALRAEGEAFFITKQIEAVDTNRIVGLAVLAKQRSVETAKAAGDKAIVVVGNGSGEVDPLQAGILQELKDIKLRAKLSLEE